RRRTVRGHDRFALVTERSVGAACGAAHVGGAAAVRGLVETQAAFPFWGGVEDWEGWFCVCWWAWSPTAVLVMSLVPPMLTMPLLTICSARSSKVEVSTPREDRKSLVALSSRSSTFFM